jgi:hypothetical protein
MGEPRSGDHLDIVGKFHFPAGLVVDGGVLDVLDKSSGSPNIERLQSVADSQYGLMEIVCVLQQKFVNIVASRIRRRSLRMPFRAKLLWINVRWASRKQDAFTPGDKLGDFMR